MLFDIVLLILSVLSFIRGWQKGLLWAIFSFVAIALGLLLSLKLSHTLADYLFVKNIVNSQYSILICFILIFLIVLWVCRLSIKIVEKMLDKVLLGTFNKILGGALYVFFTILVASMLLWLANNAKLISAESKSSSKTIQYVEPIASKTISILQPYLPYCKNLLEEVKEYSKKVNNKVDALIPSAN